MIPVMHHFLLLLLAHHFLSSALHFFVLPFSISDEMLAKKIKKEKNFYDENNNFSRTKYEKFLLQNNTSSVQFEQDIRDNELKKKLFKYISGGIKSPFFLINKNYREQLKEIEIDYLDLNSIYVKRNEITENDLKKHLNENKEKFWSKG